MKIIWNEVTGFSQIAAIALFVAVFFVAFGLGMKYGSHRIDGALPIKKIDPASGTFTVYECADGKSVWAAFRDGSVTLSLSDGSNMTLQQAVSASGARFTNEDYSLIFWNSGKEAFIEENGTTTYSACSEKAL